MQRLPSLDKQGWDQVPEPVTSSSWPGPPHWNPQPAPRATVMGRRLGEQHRGASSAPYSWVDQGKSGQCGCLPRNPKERATEQERGDGRARACAQGWLKRDVDARLEPASQGTWSWQGARGREGRRGAPLEPSPWRKTPATNGSGFIPTWDQEAHRMLHLGGKGGSGQPLWKPGSRFSVQPAAPWSGLPCAPSAASAGKPVGDGIGHSEMQLQQSPGSCLPKPAGLILVPPSSVLSTGLTAWGLGDGEGLTIAARKGLVFRGWRETSASLLLLALRVAGKESLSGLWVDLHAAPTPTWGRGREVGVV